MKGKYLVTAIWDEEAQVFYSKSDIHGLHIEAETLDEFDSLIVDLAPDLTIENDMSPEEVNSGWRSLLNVAPHEDDGETI